MRGDDTVVPGQPPAKWSVGYRSDDHLTHLHTTPIRMRWNHHSYSKSGLRVTRTLHDLVNRVGACSCACSTVTPSLFFAFFFVRSSTASVSITFGGDFFSP